MKKHLKTAIIIAVIAVLLIAGGCVWYYLGHNSSDPVYVYDFNMIGMTEYWGDSRESYGPVSSDGIQTVFLSDTQTVTEVLVSEGDTVQKGDLLLKFDTTLSDLALERKRLEVEKIKLQIEDAKAELKRINGLKPMTTPPPQEETEENLGTALKEPYYFYSEEKFAEYDGSAKDKAMVCWIRSDTSIDSHLLELARSLSEELQNANAEPEIPEEGAEPLPPTHISVHSFYMIFKTTYKDMSRGRITAWQGVHVTGDGKFRFFDASGNNDYTYELPEEDDKPQVDYFGSGLTAAQIAEMRNQQQKTIKDLEFQLKMAEAEFTIMQKEVNDGSVYAETDGRIVSLISEEEAKMLQQPMLKLSGGGGFYVEGNVNELERDDLAIGQEVTVNDWESGMMYTGSVVEVRDFPNSNNYGWGAGNPNASQYPFVVFIDESADLRAGSYVSIQYSPGTSENGVYLEKAFLRTEQGVSFVYVQGENGRLEKRIVTTGKSLWGSYIEVTTGLTAEDKLAFPYGKNLREGAKTADGDYSTLYGY